MRTTFEWTCPECEHINERTAVLHCSDCRYIGTIGCKKCMRRFELIHLDRQGYIYNPEE